MGYNVQNSRQRTLLSGKLDIFLWMLLLAIVLMIVFGNLYFSALDKSLRVTAILILSLLTIGIFRITKKGKTTWSFIKDARSELRKVVWPTRQETLRTSFLIFVVVMLMSLFLWGIDSLFALLVSSIVM